MAPLCRPGSGGESLPDIFRSGGSQSLRDASWEGSDLKKLSVNSMIGLWAAPRQYTYMTRTHEGLDDICFEGAKVRRSLNEFALEEVVLRIEQVSKRGTKLAEIALGALWHGT